MPEDTPTPFPDFIACKNLILLMMELKVVNPRVSLIRELGLFIQSVVILKVLCLLRLET